MASETTSTSTISEDTPTENTSSATRKEDYLEVDKPIPGQNFVCMSFVSPEKIINSKNNFKNYAFMKHYLGDKFTMTESQWKEEYENFLSTNEDDLEKEFSSQNNFQTSTRGIKVRGVFDTYREAQVRAQVLQRMDRSFHVFVGQVGYWLPWDPDANKIEDQEYLENELNNLVHKYKENEMQRDNYYSQQVRDRKQKAIEENEKRREEQKRSQQQRIERKRELQRLNDKSRVDQLLGEGEGEVESTSGKGVDEKSSGEQLFNTLTDSESHQDRKAFFAKKE